MNRANRKTVNAIKRNFKNYADTLVFESTGEKFVQKVTRNLRNLLEPFVRSKQIKKGVILNTGTKSNALYGQIFISLPDMEEMVILDFNIMPT